jgi:hypothetical protein
MWSDAVKKFVRENASLLKDEQIAATLSRLTGRHVSKVAVSKLRASMGIEKRMGRGYCQVVVRPDEPKS